MDQPRIFVSHSHEDSEWCRKFVSFVREKGADVWYDEHNLGYGVLERVWQRVCGMIGYTAVHEYHLSQQPIRC